MENEQPTTTKPQRGKIQKIHDYDTYSFVYTHEQVFDCLQQSKEHMIETIGMVSARLDAGQSEMNASFWCIHPPLRLDSEKQS